VDQVLSLGRRLRVRGLPQSSGNVVWTASDDVSDVLWTYVDGKDSDDASGRWSAVLVSPVDERTGCSKTDVKFTKILRVLHKYTRQL